MYLDESGNFKGQSAEPSIVAGFLAEHKLTEAEAAGLMRTVQKSDARYESISLEPFHAMEERSPHKGPFIADILENLTAEAVLVSFRNERGFAVVNSDITYLNVFAAGIVQLLVHLAKETADEIMLKVYYARRLVVRDKEKDGSVNIIGQENYQERIAERLVLRLAQLPGEIKRRIFFELSEGSARKSKLLMLADIVCFALRGGKNSLSVDDRARIRELRCLNFNVMENDVWAKIRQLLVDEQIAEALYGWYGVFGQELGTRYGGEFNTLLIDKLTQLSYEERHLQCEMLLQNITRLVSERQFKTASAIIGRLMQKLFPLLRKHGISFLELEMGVYFLRLTVAVNQGDTVSADKAIAAFKRCFQENEMTLEMVGAFVDFKLREISHLKNIFAFQEALTELDKLEKFVRQVLAAVNMVDGLRGGTLKSETLCKIFTSRAFTWCCLFGFDERAKSEAVRNIEEALAQLPKAVGGERQYMLRSRVEYLSGNVAESFHWLEMAVSRPGQKLIDVIAGDYSRWIFALMHYANIMAKAASVDSGFAGRLYADWQRAGVTEWLEQQEMEYPLNLIWWKLGSYKVQNGESAEDEFQRAIEYSFQNIKNYTVYSMGLAAAAEYLGRLPVELFRERIEGLNEAYNLFKEQPVPQSMKRYFAGCDEGFRKFSRLSEAEQQQKLLEGAELIPIV